MAVELPAPGSIPPPVVQSRGRKASVSQQTVSKTQAKRQAAMAGYGQIVVFGLTLAHMDADAMAVEDHAPAMITELARMAETDEKLAGGIDKLDQMGPWSAFIMLALPLGMQIGANHGLIKNTAPLASMGVVEPDVLLARSQAKKAEAMRYAKQVREDAQAEMAALHEEMTDSE